LEHGKRGGQLFVKDLGDTKRTLFNKKRRKKEGGREKKAVNKKSNLGKKGRSTRRTVREKMKNPPAPGHQEENGRLGGKAGDHQRTKDLSRKMHGKIPPYKGGGPKNAQDTTKKPSKNGE